MSPRTTSSSPTRMWKPPTTTRTGRPTHRCGPPPISRESFRRSTTARWMPSRRITHRTTPTTRSSILPMRPSASSGWRPRSGWLIDRLVHGKVIGIAQLVRLFSTGPAEVFNLPGGTLRQGEPADLTLLDLRKRWVVDPAKFKSKARNTPFAGRQTQRVRRWRPSSAAGSSGRRPAEPVAGGNSQFIIQNSELRPKGVLVLFFRSRASHGRECEACHDRRIHHHQ